MSATATTVIDNTPTLSVPTATDTSAGLRQKILTRQRRDHRFYLILALCGALAVVIGYSPTYYLKPLQSAGLLRTSPGLTTLIHIHAAVFSLYVVFYVLQTGLISRGSRTVHMMLGWASLAFIPAMVVLGTLSVFWGASLGHKQVWPDLETAALVNIVDVYLFAILAVAGVLLRKSPEAHRRLMSLSFMTLLPAPLARTGLILIGTDAVGIGVFSFLLAGPIYDLVTRRRLHPAYVCGLLLVIPTGLPARLALASTPAWHHFVHRVISSM